MQTEFNETQRMGNWIFIILGMDVIVVSAIMLNEYFNGNMALNELLITMSLIFIINSLIVILILSTKQHTRINSLGVHYRYPPFHPKWTTIPLESITDFKIESYDKLSYGYAVGKWNFFSKYDMVTTMGLDKVISIDYRAKKPIKIGTQKTNEFYTLLKKLKNQEDYV